MSDKPEDATCRNCCYWAFAEEECRRDPPTMFDDDVSGWPHTEKDMWCGCFTHKWSDRKELRSG